ncbi:hypothetical protein BCR37DRAFT_386717 [Protomyces lactucae-debilis]|uniref:Histone transcription regulator 3 homolog n=1 Tax=Protomyces lactucae-debilis TaxID=2754530 RepID=A0A1Y2FLP0_PROLT|nr:uncharacterized protein BCR37DRAFT_386717 [Protomyces lactucae-debilis]ORY83685.1 hypothetical protein BCR37DRAFT_386717 [Protomyces lactucae-debilis]
MEHIREVELENAVKLYQEALKAHHRGDLDDAAIAYEQLIASSILQDADKPTTASRREGPDALQSSAAKLPALVYRNHATLLLQRFELQQHPQDQACNVFQNVLASYATALSFDPDDTVLWRRTLEIGDKLNDVRVKRVALESLLESTAIAETATRGLFWHNAADPYAEEVRSKLVKLVDCIHQVGDAEMSDRLVIKSNGEEHDRLANFTPLQLRDMSALSMGNLLLQHYSEQESLPPAGVRLYKMTRPETAQLAESAQLESDQPHAKLHDITEDEVAPEEHLALVTTETPAADDHPDLEHAENAEQAASPDKRQREEDEVPEQELPPSPKRVKVAMNLTGAQGQLFFTEWLHRLFDPIDVHFNDFLALDASPPLNGDDTTESPTSAYEDLKQFLYNDWSEPLYEASKEMTHTAAGDSFAASMMLAFPDIRRVEQTEGSMPSALLPLLDREPTPLRALGVSWLHGLLASESSSYLIGTWSTQLLAVVRKISMADELLLLRQVKQAQFSVERGQSDSTDAIYFAQAILELRLDQLVEEQRLALVESDRQECAHDILASAQRWSGQVRLLLCLSPGRANLECRFAWARVLLSQLSGATPEDLIDDLTSLRGMIGETRIVLPNVAAMQHVDSNTLDLEIQKFKTMGFFDEMFGYHATGHHERLLSELEPILLPNGELSGKDLLVSQYLQHAPTSFRSQLWQWLADACFAQGDQAKGVYISLCSLEQLNASLFQQDYKTLLRPARQQAVLQMMHRCGEVVGHVAHLVNSHMLDTLTFEQCVRCMQALTTFGTLCMVAAYHDDYMAENDDALRDGEVWVECRDLLRRRFVEFWVITYRFFARALEARKVADAGVQLGALLSTLHEELGTRRYCSLADGLLLALLEDEIYRLNRVEMENDLVQVFHCRYDLGFVVGNFWPWEHSAVPIELSLESAARITPFFFTMVTERSPGLWLPKNDLRSALQKVHDKLWPPLKLDEMRLRNESILDAFLDSEIVPKEFMQCLTGGVLLPFKEVSQPSDVSMDAWTGYRDINLVLARIHMSLYKTRNKQTPGKGFDELDSARYYLHWDLTLQPGRVESWRSLAFAYGALADHEVSSDAERIVANKKTICDLRKSALLCSMMAVSIAIQQSRRGEEDSGLTEVGFCDLLYEFGLQIYSAARGPFEMCVFERHASRYLQRGFESPREEQVAGVTLPMALRVACKCLSRASRSCSVKWTCHLLLGKAHAKLNLPPTVALDDFVKAIQEAPERGSTSSFYGPLIEPDFRLVSSVAKYVLTDDVSIPVAIEYLRDTPFTADLLPLTDEEVFTKRDVMEVIVKTLQAIRLSDKKQWHHRPIHRQAQLLLEGYGSFELEEDVKATPQRLAQACLESLFTVKGSGGNLLSIWRPETERPGRHFVYAKRYTMMYVDLLVKQGDIEGLKNFMRRARKAMANILDHKQVWEEMCMQYITMMLDVNEVENGLQEAFLESLMSDEFVPAAKRLEQVVSIPDFIQPSLFVMRELYDLRKLNGGLYETAEVDDVIIDCYISLYNFVDDMTDAELGIEDNNENNQADTLGAPPASPSASTVRRNKIKEAKVVKITRKEVLNRAFTLCKPKTVVPMDSRRREARTSMRLADGANEAEEEEVMAQHDLGLLQIGETVEPVIATEQDVAASWPDESIMNDTSPPVTAGASANLAPVVDIETTPPASAGDA